MKLPPDQFRCAFCGRTYDKKWTDEEALTEAQAVFTDEELADVVDICEPCWLILRAAVPAFDQRYKESDATT
jgi:hypothetical protein